MLRGRPAAATISALILILLLGAYLRFDGIDKRGPSFFDDGVYTLEGKWIYSFAGLLIDELQRKYQETRLKQDLVTFEDAARRIGSNLEGQPPVWGRPGFSLLTALCMILVGRDRPEATNVVSAVCGTLSILGVFFLARAMFNNRIALMAALLTALSGYHLVYSVTGLADGPAMCFGVCAMYFYYTASRASSTERERKGLSLPLAGFVCGIAFTIHDRFLYLLLVIFCSEAVESVLKRNPVGPSLRRLAVITVAFSIPPLLCEFPYYLGMVVLRHFQHVLPFRTYFEELFSHHIFNFLDVFSFSLVDVNRYPVLREAGSHLLNFFTYPYLFWKLDGPVFCTMVLCGIGVSLAQRRFEDRLLGLWLFVPCVLFSLGLVTSVRYALVFMPAATILAARSISLCPRVFSNDTKKAVLLRRSSTVVGLLAVAASGWYASRDIRAIHCSYDEPVAFLRNHGIKHISSQYPVTRAYLGVSSVREPPSSLEELKAAYEEGYRYYVIDYRKFFMKPPSRHEAAGKVIEQVESSIQPVFTYEHPCYRLPCFVFEVNIFFKLTLKLLREGRGMGIDQVRIYDLKDYFEKKGSVSDLSVHEAGGLRVPQTPVLPRLVHKGLQPSDDVRLFESLAGEEQVREAPLFVLDQFGERVNHGGRHA